MPRIPSVWKGKDRLTPLVPAGRVSLGDKVWWQESYWLAGHQTTYWKVGIIQVKRGKMCVIRDRYNHEWTVAVGMLFKPETET
jgi:hypothetical protein